MTRRTPMTLALVVPLLALIAAAPAWAGGEKCRDHAAKTTKTAAHDAETDHHDKAEAIRQGGWAGMEADRAEDGSYRVTYVAAGTPAAEAGVRVGDRLVAYQGIALTDANKDAIHAAKKGRKVGAEVAYTLERDGARRDVVLTLAEVPETVVARWVRGESARADTVASVDR